MELNKENPIMEKIEVEHVKEATTEFRRDCFDQCFA